MDAFAIEDTQQVLQALLEDRDEAEAELDRVRAQLPSTACV